MAVSANAYRDIRLASAQSGSSYGAAVRGGLNGSGSPYGALMHYTGSTETQVATWSDSALAVTGALSVTSTNASSVFTDSARYMLLSLVSSGTNQSSYLEFKPTGTGNGVVQLNGSDKLTISSTGLAVTGALSSTTGANFATSSGSVGIGTASPAYKLSISASNVTGGIFVQDTDAANPSPVIRVQGNRIDNNSSQSFSGGLVLERYNSNGSSGLVSGNTLGTIYFGGNYNTTPTYTYPASISAIADANWSSTSAASTALVFFTGSTGQALGTANVAFGTERMRIDSSGNVGIGTTTPTTALTIRKAIDSAAYGSGTQMIDFKSYFPGYDTETVKASIYAGVSSSGSLNTQGGYLAFMTSDNGTLAERARIEKNGNVGIGTTSPSQLLTFGNATAGLGIGWGDTSGNYTNIFAPYSASGLVLATGFQGSRSSDTYTSSYGGGAMYRSGIRLNAFGNGNIQFFTDGSSTVASGSAFTPTERMRIATDGTLFLHKTAYGVPTVGYEFRIGGETYNSIADSTNSTVTWAAYSTTASAYRFYVGLGGTVYATNTTISGISDRRVKENIVDLDVGLDAIMALKPRKFDWKAGKGKDIKNDRGFIAQEFETVFPDLIDTWKDEAPEGEEPYKSVRADLIPVIVKALQELKADNDSLRARIATLELN
jgi:hypothetical protein